MDFAIAKVKSEAIVSIHEMSEKYFSVCKKLTVFSKPNREVKAAAAFEKHKLVLVPCSNRIDVKTETSTSGSSVPLGRVNVLGQAMVVSILPPSGYVVPFFWLRHGSQKSDANMEIAPGLLETEFSGKVRVARNTRKVNAGDTLVLFKPATPKPVADLTLVPEEGRPNKRSKRQA